MTIKTFKGKFRWLSNFAKCVVSLDDEEYPTVEHAYQAAKTTDKWQRTLIREAPTPTAAKKIGRKVNLRADWHDIKLGVMAGLLQQKFNQPLFKQLLLATGDQEIQEGNTWGDTFYGVDIYTGIGENNLGKMIVKIRQKLRRIGNAHKG